ncbi:hypothetical protein [Halovenus halobia]|uniref:hypothetical protein n=1 Tax=Halovenus halobia TaxID=3396622 RepID=UPI003F54DD3A
MNSTDDSADNGLHFDAEEDLLRRYEQMIQTQISTLNDIDDKAAYVARLVAILTGLILSAASLAASRAEISLNVDTGAVLLLTGSSVSAFFISVVLAILTYLKSEFEYGPTIGMGRYMSRYKVDEQQYKDVLLRSYATAIENNRTVVVANARRFQTSLAALLAGLFLLFGSAALLVLPPAPMVQYGTAGLFVIAATCVALVINHGAYLRLEEQDHNNE